MSNKITVPLLAIVSGLAVFLGIQNMSLNKEIEKLSAPKEQVQLTPMNSATGNPFDQPNTDPLAPVTGVSATAPQAPTDISFDRMIHDFGTINEGDKVKTTFKFKNTGKNPLIISNATGSCGCTVPQWPKEPIQPGAGGEIAVEFDSNGKRGQNEKNVTVTANTNPPATMLIIKSTVTPKDK